MIYTADEIVKLSKVADTGQMWNGQIACLLIHKEDLVLQQAIEGASAFSFAMVKSGSLTVDYNGTEMVLTPTTSIPTRLVCPPRCYMLQTIMKATV